MAPFVLSRKEVTVHPYYWHPEIELNPAEVKICARARGRHKFYVFLRKHRHELFDEAFQKQLLSSYSRIPSPTAAIKPAMLAMVLLLQARDNLSDEEAVGRATFDVRWRMVLGVLESEEAPFCQATLVNFRRRLIEHNLDKALLERTVEIAEKTGAFGARQLRLALDSSPVFGAGKVEDTLNMLAHALHDAVKAAAKQQNGDADALIEAAGLSLTGKSSLKAALDLDWSEAEAKQQALTRLVDELERWKAWLDTQREVAEQPRVGQAMQSVEQILEQDTEVDAAGQRRLRRGVAKRRRVSVRDAEMGHGRKSKSKCFTGFKEHDLVDLDSRVIREVVVCSGYEPDLVGLDLMRCELERAELAEFKIDLGYMGHECIERWARQGVQIVARAWPERSGEVFGKRAFELDFEAGLATCPAGKSAPLAQAGVASVVRFKSRDCRACPLRAQCTREKKGRPRQLTIRADEPLQLELARQMKTSEGRARYRERVKVEHRFAHQFSRRSRRARYIGIRKNQFDGRRHAALNNLMLAIHYEEQHQLPST